MAKASRQPIWFITGASRGFGLEIARIQAKLAKQADEMKRWRQLPLSAGYASAA